MEPDWSIQELRTAGRLDERLSARKRNRSEEIVRRCSRRNQMEPQARLRRRQTACVGRVSTWRAGGLLSLSHDQRAGRAKDGRERAGG